MNFDERDSHWESFLQDKANLSQSFMKDTCCKVCLCLELLKLSVCNGSCYRPQEENELVDRLLHEILDPETFSAITDKLKAHFSNLSTLATIQDKVADLERTVKRTSEKIIDLDVSAKLEKANKVERSSESGKLDSLFKRIESYEETLTHLRKENEELRAYLQKASKACDEYSKINQKSAGEIIKEFEVIREEQNKIKAAIDSISKNLNDNTLAVKELKNFKEVQRDDADIKAFRMQVSEDLKEFIDKTMITFKKLQDNGSESQKKIEELFTQLKEIKKNHDAVMSWQKECAAMSQHSSHLLTAADSVYSALQQLQDFNHLLEAKLDMIRKEMEIRLPDKKPGLGDEAFHPGSCIYDEEDQQIIFTCCKMPENSKGCQKR